MGLQTPEKPAEPQLDAKDTTEKFGLEAGLYKVCVAYASLPARTLTVQPHAVQASSCSSTCRVVSLAICQTGLYPVPMHVAHRSLLHALCVHWQFAQALQSVNVTCPPTGIDRTSPLGLSDHPPGLLTLICPGPSWHS